MSFSYHGPAAGVLYEVRYRIGDTVEALALLSDEEISWELSEASNNTLTASLACIDKMLALIASDTLVSADGMTRDLSGRRESLEKLRVRLLTRQSMASASPFLGGASIAERDTRKSDTDLIQPDFYAGQWEHSSRENDKYKS